MYARARTALDNVRLLRPAAPQPAALRNTGTVAITPMAAQRGPERREHPNRSITVAEDPHQAARDDGPQLSTYSEKLSASLAACSPTEG